MGNTEKGRRMTKSDIKRIIDVYNETNGNLRKTSRITGFNRITVKRYVDKIKPEPLADVKSGSIACIADELAERIKSMPNVKELNFQALAKKLGSNNIVAVLTDPKKFDETTREIARIAFMRVLVEMLDEEKLNSASINALSSVIPVLADAASGKYEFIDPKSMGNITTEDIIIKIQAGIRRIQQFNPTLSKKVKAEMEKALGVEPTKIIDVKEVKGGKDGK